MITQKYFIPALIACMMIFCMTGCDNIKNESDDISTPDYPSWIDASRKAHKERINVTWEMIANADYYVVTKSEGDRYHFQEIECQIPESAYYDEDVEAGKTYFYKVKAVNAAGESVYGPSAEGSTMKDTEADRVASPTWLTATKGTETNRVILMWDDTDAESYNIYRKEKDGGAYCLIRENNTANAFEDYDVDSGVHYQYTVEAVSGNYNSEFSPCAEGYSGEPGDLTPAEFYEILKPIIEHVWKVIDDNEFIFPMEISGAFGGSIYAVMEAVNDSHGDFIGSTVTLEFNDFNQEGHVANGTLTLDLDTILSGDETGTLTITGAHNATIEFHITIGPRPDGHSSEQGGHYVISTGGPSETIDWRAPDIAIVLYPPENILASKAVYFGFVRLTWDASSRAVAYNVYRSEYMYGDYALIAENVAITAYDDYEVELDAEARYFYKISACYGEIESELSLPYLGYPGTVPDEFLPPSGVTATDGDYASYIDIFWQASVGGKYYRVYRSLSADGTYSPIGANTTAMSYRDSSVTPNVQYYYKIKAYNNTASVESELSGYDSGYAGSLTGLPDIPSNVSATDKSANDKEKVVVTWNPVGAASYYRVYRSTSENGNYELVSANLYSTSFEDRGIYLDTVYYYRVKAVNSAGESDFSSADQGSRQITIDEFYHDIFRPASKYAKNRIYERFPEPTVGNQATFYGDNGGTMYFKVSLYSWSIWSGARGKTTIIYTNLADGDLNKATTGADEGGIILNGEITGLVWDGSGEGTQNGTLEVTGSHTATCDYHLKIVDKITSGGYTTVTFNGETKDITYTNTDDE